MGFFQHNSNYCMNFQQQSAENIADTFDQNTRAVGVSMSKRHKFVFATELIVAGPYSFG